MRNLLVNVAGKILIAVLCYVSFIITSNINSFAQTPPKTCGGACPDSVVWQYPGATSICGDTLGCSFIVDYRWRECGGTREVEILKITLVSGGMCTGLNDGIVVKQAVKAVLSRSHSIFGVTGGSPFEISINMPACLVRSFQGFDYILTNGGCDSACCTSKYMVHQNRDGFEEITSQTPGAPQTCGGPTGGCPGYCENMQQPENTPLIPFQWILSQGCPSDTIRCDTIPWEKKAAYYSDPQKSMAIYYSYKKCPVPSLHYEMQVRRIDIIRGYTWMAYEWIRFGYLRALHHLIDSSMGSDPRYQTVKIFAGPCWNVSRPNSMFEPCISNRCCYRIVKIDRLMPGDSHIVREDNPVLIDSGMCMAPCDWQCKILNEIWRPAGSLPRISDRPDIEIDDNTVVQTLEDGQLIVKPVPAGDIVKFNYYSQQKGSLSLNIYDGAGNTVGKYPFQKLTSELEMDIDVSSYINGIYFYELKINNQTIKGRFMVYK